MSKCEVDPNYLSSEKQKELCIKTLQDMGVSLNGKQKETISWFMQISYDLGGLDATKSIVEKHKLTIVK